jgi:hypothetical protein
MLINPFDETTAPKGFLALLLAAFIRALVAVVELDDLIWFKPHAVHEDLIVTISVGYILHLSQVQAIRCFCLRREFQRKYA